MDTVGGVLQFVIWVAILVLIARFVADWVQLLARDWRPSGVMAVVLEGLYTVTDPPIRAIRSVLPPVRLGNVMLDLAPMILLIILFLLLRVVSAVFTST